MASRSRFRREPKRVGDLMARALRDLGVPSRRITQEIETAWENTADPQWSGQVAPLGIEGGVLKIGVRAAALRDELANFHQDRLLSVLQTALPDVVLVGLRFVMDGDDGRSGAGGSELAD